MRTTPSAPIYRDSAWIIPAALLLSAVLLAIGATHAPDTQPKVFEPVESASR